MENIMYVCRQEFIQLENETVYNEAVIEEREQGIREIHTQIGEVNEIFKDLAVLVHEQGYMIGTWCNQTDLLKLLL
jgi:syntaxin 7